MRAALVLWLVALVAPSSATAQILSPGKLAAAHAELEGIRQQRNLPVDGELFALIDDSDDETPPSGNVRHLGA